MAEPLPAETLDLLSLLRAGEAPPEIRRFAARGLLPLDHDGQMRALLAVLDDPDADIGDTARATFAERPPDELSRFLETADPTGVEIDTLTRHCSDGAVLERAVRHRNVDDQTLLRMARTVTGSPQDALVVNQVRLLRLPALIDALFENPELTSESRRRLNETREEFFDKEERRRLAEERRIQEALEAEDAARAAAEAGEAEAEGEEAAEGEAAVSEEDAVAAGALHRRIGVMNVQEKVNLAYSGGKEERRILIGDSNTLVGQAVLKSRGLTINEIESFCSMRHLDSEIFRRIAANREWMRKQPVIVALVKNPAVPIAISLPLVKRLAPRDMKAVMRDPNLPEGVRLTAKKLLEEKRR
ncbi:MAG TPA: hypothetical protein VIA45_12390 [Thermoanaerobaculia bacterium]